VQSFFKKAVFLLAFAFAALVFALTITVDVGSSGNPNSTTADDRSSMAVGKIVELGGTVLPGDRVIARFNDGWISEIQIQQISNNMWRPVEVVAPYREYRTGGSGGGEGAGGCGGGGGYYQPVGSWQSYSATVGGVTATRWEYVTTGWEWVPQSCN
jgi:hypothetical protein